MPFVKSFLWTTLVIFTIACAVSVGFIRAEQKLYESCYLHGEYLFDIFGERAGKKITCEVVE